MKRRENGAGSVFYNEARKRWEAVAPWPSRLTRTGKTHAEAIRRRDAALVKAGNIAHVSAKQTLREYLTAWLSTKAADVSARTFDGYKTIIEEHISKHIGDVRLCDLKPQHVQRMLDLESSPWTRHAAYQRLKAALELAVKWDILSKNPADKVDVPATPDAPVVPMAEDHFYALLVAIRGDRLEALWRLLLAVGARRGEGIAISKAALDLDAKTVTIHRSLQRVRGKLTFIPKTKTKQGNRTLALPDSEIPFLRAHLTRQKEERLKAGELWEEHDLVFCTKRGRPLEPRNVTRRWYEILAAAKIPRTKLKDGTRHTAISMLLRDGADIYAVQAMAGHSKPTTTLGIYGHLMSKPTVTAEKMNAVMTRKKG